MPRTRILQLTTAAFLFAALGINSAFAGNYQTEPIELLIDFKISGQVTGGTPTEPIFTINGPGFAPWLIFRNGEIVDATLPWRQVTTLEGGQITFTGGPADPVIKFTCLPGSCNMRFHHGSILTSDAGVPLDGRAINMWGPVINSPDFDPVNRVFPIRILGCGGLKEKTGTGEYAGMVGSICFNGVLNFDKLNPQQLTGSSKCTITLHTPDPNIPIP